MFCCFEWNQSNEYPTTKLYFIFFFLVHCKIDLRFVCFSFVLLAECSNNLSLSSGNFFFLFSFVVVITNVHAIFRELKQWYRRIRTSNKFWKIIVVSICNSSINRNHEDEALIMWSRSRKNKTWFYGLFQCDWEFKHIDT